MEKTQANRKMGVRLSLLRAVNSRVMTRPSRMERVLRAKAARRLRRISGLGSLLRCPAIYAIVVGLILYLFQIPLPTLITQPMELLGNMNTPLSMLITGMLIASGDLRRILTDKHIWELTVVRMFFIPVLTIAAFAALGLFRYGMATHRTSSG